MFIKPDLNDSRWTEKPWSNKTYGGEFSLILYEGNPTPFIKCMRCKRIIKRVHGYGNLT